MPGRGACPRGALSLTAESTPTLSTPPPRPVSSPSSVSPRQPFHPRLLSPAQRPHSWSQPFQMDLKPPSHIWAWPWPHCPPPKVTVLSAQPCQHPPPPVIQSVAGSLTPPHAVTPAPPSAPTPCRADSQVSSKSPLHHRPPKTFSDLPDGFRGPSWGPQRQPGFVSTQPRPLFG